MVVRTSAPSSPSGIATVRPVTRIVMATAVQPSTNSGADSMTVAGRSGVEGDAGGWRSSRVRVMRLCESARCGSVYETALGSMYNCGHACRHEGRSRHDVGAGHGVPLVLHECGL